MREGMREGMRERVERGRGDISGIKKVSFLLLLLLLRLVHAYTY